MKLWYATEKGRTCAVVKSSRKLEDEKNWKDLKNVSEMFIEDEDGVIRNIPPYITSLGHLRILSIRWAKFTGLNTALLPRLLTHLCLAYNHLHSAAGLEEMSSLVVLNIANNEISSLPNNLSNLKNLKELDVSGNKLSKIPDSIRALRHQLRILNLSSNRLSHLTNAVCDLDKVRVVDVSMNMLVSLPERIGNMRSLTELYASDNKIVSFPPSIQSCSSLRYLHVRKNRLTEVPQYMEYLIHLEVMNLRQNNLVDFQSPLSSLKSLLIDTNDFRDMPEALFKCHNLEFLSMEDNLLKRIPSEIQELRRLRALYLSYNEIAELPSELCSLDQLKHLVLHGNKMTRLPLEFYCLHNLSILNLEEMDLDPDIRMAYREGVSSLMEHMRKKAHGDTVTLNPKKTLPEKEISGSKTAVIVRNSMLRTSGDSMTGSKPNIRGRYAVSTPAGSLASSRENTIERKKPKSELITGSRDSVIAISRARPGTNDRPPEVHPGHVGKFQIRASDKRKSSLKRASKKDWS